MKMPRIRCSPRPCWSRQRSPEASATALDSGWFPSFPEALHHPSGSTRGCQCTPFPWTSSHGPIDSCPEWIQAPCFLCLIRPSFSWLFLQAPHFSEIQDYLDVNQVPDNTRTILTSSGPESLVSLSLCFVLGIFRENSAFKQFSRRRLSSGQLIRNLGGKNNFKKGFLEQYLFQW